MNALIWFKKFCEQLEGSDDNPAFPSTGQRVRPFSSGGRDDLSVTGVRPSSPQSGPLLCCSDSGATTSETPEDLPIAATTLTSAWWFRGLWWGILAGAILLFCGQTSKFIYIDF